MENKALYFLVGPTAVGKTALAVRWCEAAVERPREILSCDSLQVYRGMDIGTAKPTEEERAQARHHGIDLSDPGTPFNVVDFAAYAKQVVEDAGERGVDLLICGGSGFYLKSFFTPVIDPVQVPESVARSVRALYREGGYPAMVARLKALNPDGLGALDVQNPRRVMRALERCLAAAKPLSLLQEEFRRLPLPFAEYSKHVCLLHRSPEALRTRVGARSEQMLAAGLVEEVQRLLEIPGFRDNPSAAGAIGYRECIAALAAGQPDPVALAEEIAANTMKLVKKQRTWFRHQIPVGAELSLDDLDVDSAVVRLFATSPDLPRHGGCI